MFFEYFLLGERSSMNAKRVYRLTQITLRLTVMYKFHRTPKQLQTRNKHYQSAQISPTKETDSVLEYR